MFPADESIAIGELVVYPPVLIALLFVLARHGLRRESGFVFLASFTIVRIIGASFQIAAVKSPSISNTTWATVLQALGLGPLIMSTLSLLKRTIDQTSTHVRSNSGNEGINSILPRIPIVGLLYRMISGKATASSRRSRVIQCLHFGSIVPLILFIIGATHETSDNSSDQRSGKAMIKAGFVLFVVMYAILVFLAAKSASEFNKIPVGEKRILAAVLVAIPLLAVRILFGILAIFTDFSAFSSQHGSPAVRVCMSILEEFIIVVMYTFVGLTVPRYIATESDRLESQIPLAKQSLLPPNAPYPAPYPAPHAAPQGYSNRNN